MENNKQLLKDTLLWGFILWLFGYILGIILFMFVPTSMIGWVIGPFAIAFTLWILIKKVKSTSLQHFLIIGVVWTIMAIVLDYFLIVKAFNPTDGYYKLDVYIYYILTLILPIAVGVWKGRRTAG